MPQLAEKNIAIQWLLAFWTHHNIITFQNGFDMTFPLNDQNSVHVNNIKKKKFITCRFQPEEVEITQQIIMEGQKLQV